MVDILPGSMVRRGSAASRVVDRTPPHRAATADIAAVRAVVITEDQVGSMVAAEADSMVVEAVDRTAVADTAK